MPQHLLLIHGHEAEYDPSDDRLAPILAGHEAFGREYGDAIRAGNSVQPPSTAVTVRMADGGGHTVTDGPFDASTPGLGGYYLVDAAGLDEAIALAAAIPTVGGGVEVRPVG